MPNRGNETPFEREEREGREENWREYWERRDRHLPVILDSDDPDNVPWKPKEDLTMNDDLQTYARDTIKAGLARCTEKQQVMFKLMYSEPGEPRLRTPEVVAQIKAAGIEDVVDGMPEERLSLAMEQVEATHKLNQPKEEPRE